MNLSRIAGAAAEKKVSARSTPCGNLETEVKKAARAVAQADKAFDTAEAKVTRAEAAAGAARVDRDEANGDRIAKLWLLGDWLEKWEEEFGPHKHRGTKTFFAQAVDACGNDDLYYRARKIRGPHGYVSEEAARKAGEADSQRTILDRIAGMKRASKATRRASRKPGKPAAKAAVDPEGQYEDEPDEPLTTEELKLETKLWFCNFSPGFPEPEELKPEAVPAAILFAVDHFYPGGLDAAVAWLKGVQRERLATAAPMCDDVPTTVVYTQEDEYVE